jgi:hypothetical protein
MKVLLKADGRGAVGGTPLVMHNDRLSDPLDSCAQAVAAVSKKRNKTLADYEELGRREYIGGLYTVPPIEVDGKGLLTSNSQIPCIPAWNVLRCLQQGAQNQKRGLDVPRGVQPIDEVGKLSYEGPHAPEELWKDVGYVLRKPVMVRGNKTVRNRPLFGDWMAQLLIEVDVNILDVHTLRTAWAYAGKYVGLGELRPIYGRFVGTAEVVKDGKK